MDEKKSMRDIMDQLVDRKKGKPSNRVEYANIYFRELNDTERALDILEEMRLEFFQLEGMVKTRGFGKNSVTKNKWAQWQSSFPELVSSLVYIYRNNDRLMDAELILSDWVDRNPSDKNAKKILEEIRSAE